ncbi:alpha-tocopherol transfer protein, partial [Tachysurus ichikawai]
MKASEPGNVTELNDLPLDAKQIKPYLLELRHRAEKEPVIKPLLNLSDNFLIRFLRARDFDVELALK